MMNHKIRVMITEDQINLRIKELAEQISRDYEGESVHLICILKGSAFFSCDLAKRFTIPVTLDFMSVSSYGSESVSSGRVRILKDLDEPILDRNVLIVEDIIDSGHTLAHLKNLLGTRSPKSLEICTLLDKPDRRVTNVDVKYVGFVIPDEFVVGYGLDYDQFLRNLPYVGVVES